MTLKFIYQLIILLVMGCCIVAITIITIHTLQDMLDAVTANISRARIPMP
jgi:hypothetical protein